ncbi:glycine-rich cell wall structural protein-like [Solanum verrucosum]|uniref:glycine-rich cell wall structural protein-like n=1 Tax=Solanum verrucosum TaxID=315347 RepID=UPI0020D1C0E6|nr:glycine-rich cell wall structural protein-like [Solanum verrucosum]
MGSKTFMFLGLFLAIYVMISSEVVAKEFTETSEEKSKKSNNKNVVHEDQFGGGYPGGGGGYPGGGGGYPGGGYPGGGRGHGGYPGGGRGGGGRGGGGYPGGGRGGGGVVEHCRNGCCNGNNYECYRCC